MNITILMVNKLTNCQSKYNIISKKIFTVAPAIVSYMFFYHRLIKCLHT